MANITLQNSIDGVFDILNQIFRLQTQVDSSFADRRSQWGGLQSVYGPEFTSAAWVSALSSAEAAIQSESANVYAVCESLRSMAQQVVISRVDESVNLVSADFSSALTELVSQMVERAQSLKLPAVTISAVSDTGNTGDLFIVSSRRSAGGADNPQLFNEIIDVSASLAFGVTAVLSITSDAVKDGLSPLSFGGSGLNGYLQYYSTASGITGNSGLNAFTTSASVLPGSWVANVGALGTAVKSGLPQIDTVTVTGTPTAGTYRITCTTSLYGVQSTGNLTYNASAAQIQAAIAAMPGFSRVSVSATGTTPDFIHSITYNGMREAVTTATVNSTNTGTLTVATPTAYADPSLGSSPVILVSDGATLVSASHLLTHLTAKTAYAVNAFLALNTAAASGVIEFSLTNGLGGSILTDDAGNSLSYTIQATDLTTSYQGSAKLMAGGNSQAWTLAVSGTPTAGTYTITLTDAVNGARTTSALAYNASAATVQTALRLLTGAGVNATVVTSTGSTPNFTHAIQFNGTAASITVTKTDSTTGGTHALTATQTVAFGVLSPIWMTPTVLPASIYFRIRTSTTMPNTRKLYIENPVVGVAVQLYVGGPFAGAFSGPLGAKAGDLWVIQTTNDYSGITSWGMERNFGMRERGLLIPHSASPTITEATTVATGSGTCWYAWSGSAWVLMANSCLIGSPTQPGSAGTALSEPREGTCV